jgi:hypothetical protein
MHFHNISQAGANNSLIQIYFDAKKKGREKLI